MTKNVDNRILTTLVWNDPIREITISAPVINNAIILLFCAIFNWKLRKNVTKSRSIRNGFCAGSGMAQKTITQHWISMKNKLDDIRAINQ